MPTQPDSATATDNIKARKGHGLQLSAEGDCGRQHYSAKPAVLRSVLELSDSAKGLKWFCSARLVNRCAECEGGWPPVVILTAGKATPRDHREKGTL